MVQLSLGARVRKSPFFEATIRHGVTHFSTYNHVYMPTSYGDPAAEYDRLLNGVSMWDVSCERQVELLGRDAAALAQYLCPRDLSRCQIGQGIYAPLCDHAGRLINDPVLLKLNEEQFWLSIADSDIVLWARAIAAERNLDVKVSEPDVSPLAVQGPKAEDLIAGLFGEWVRSLRYFWFRETELDGIPVVVARSGWSKQGGFELYLRDGTLGQALWDKVWQAGESYGIGPGTPNYIERVESALVSYGADTDAETTPLELGLERFLDLDIEADFVGKQALKEMLAQGGPKRLFRGLFLDSPTPLPGVEHKCEVSVDGVNAGYISVNTWSPRLDRNIGLAMLARPLSATGQTVVAHLPGGDISATVTDLPFCAPGSK